MKSFAKFTTCGWTTFILSMLLFAMTVKAQTPADFQKPPIRLEAADVLPTDLLKGDNYSVVSDVTNDGFINAYKLKTRFGAYSIHSTELLKIRINEMRALHHMETVEQTEVFKDAFVTGAKAPGTFAKNLVTSPIDTTTNMASGIGRWFSDIGRSVTSDDPYQENVLKTAVGYAVVKRQFAYHYGIDPYTDFEPVQEQLTKIAKAGFAGGLTPKLAFQAVPNAVGTIVRVTSTSEGMRKLVRDNSPGELAKLNKDKLLAMGVSEELADFFIGNPEYTPQEATLLVGELDNMPKVKGRATFIGIAAMADQKGVVRFMRRRAQMMSEYNKKIAAAEKIVDINGSSFLVLKDGTIVGLVPLDHVAWTLPLWRKIETIKKEMKDSQRTAGKEIWLEGTIDPQARKALAKEGWVVKANVGDKLTPASKPSKKKQ